VHIRKLAILLVLVAVGATACGSSSKGASNATTTTAAGSGSTPTAGGGTTTSGAPTTSGKVSGDSNSTFCQAVRGDLGAFKSNANIATSTPADLKKLYSNLKSTLDDAESIAPSAIKPDFQTFVTAFTPILNTLAQYNYDFTKIPPSAYAGFQSMDTPAIKAASAHIEAYVEQVCHVSPTSTP
jgi:hypothetical protein